MKTESFKKAIILVLSLMSISGLFGIEMNVEGRAHDPSTIVCENGKFYFFYTGRGIPSKISLDLTNWQEYRRVFETPLPWWTNIVADFRGFIWAPDIAKFNNRWHLYYSVSSWGRNRSAIGLAVNKTLDDSKPDYRWEDRGIVVESHNSDNYNTIDPAVFIDGEKVWLVFGSYWSGIKLIELNPKTGKRISPNSPLYSLASSQTRDIEAPFLYKHGAYYYLFVNYGQCCRGINSTYNIRVGRSKNVAGPYIDKTGRDMREGGGEIFLQTDKDKIGPGHSGIFKLNQVEYFSYHFYNGNNNGRPSIMIRRLQWETNDWPVLTKE